MVLPFEPFYTSPILTLPAPMSSDLLSCYPRSFVAVTLRTGSSHGGFWHCYVVGSLSRCGVATTQNGNRSWWAISDVCLSIPDNTPWAVPCSLWSPCLAFPLDGRVPTLWATWEMTTPEPFGSLSLARGVGGFSSDMFQTVTCLKPYPYTNVGSYLQLSYFPSILTKLSRDNKGSSHGETRLSTRA